MRTLMHCRLAAILFAGLTAFGSAIAEPAGETSAAQAEDHEMVAWRDRYLALGEDVYEWACAACHAEGKDGAPVTGDRQGWSKRSPLWSAVLLDHANEGLLEMPAKGGHPYLSDRAVQAAVEYMLGETFPDQPRD